MLDQEYTEINIVYSQLSHNVGKCLFWLFILQRLRIKQRGIEIHLDDVLNLHCY